MVNSYDWKVLLVQVIVTISQQKYKIDREYKYLSNVQKHFLIILKTNEIKLIWENEIKFAAYTTVHYLRLISFHLWLVIVLTTQIE